MASRTHRLFIAVPLPDHVRRAIGEELPRQLPGWRWVAPERYHVTLSFLGELHGSDLEAVREAMAETAERGAPFELRAASIGAFPRPSRAITVWVGVAGDTEELAALQADLVSELSHAGFVLEAREYQPHVTVARPRRPQPLPEALRHLFDAEFGSWTVDRIQLYESRLSSAGPRYELLDEAPFPG
ncbi:MAG: RNA 2',3'-cyclic phosphodiesterase [Deinococcales bacterium]|nr:RNA 2',3'-cyclic phosphodiesterase [Deinococcales bacterium]